MVVGRERMCKGGNKEQNEREKNKKSGFALTVEVTCRESQHTHTYNEGPVR